MKTKQIGFKVSEETAMKIKYVAWFEREPITGLHASIVEDRIKAFEAKNGPITPEQLAKLKK